MRKRWNRPIPSGLPSFRRDARAPTRMFLTKISCCETAAGAPPTLPRAAFREQIFRPAFVLVAAERLH